MRRATLLLLALVCTLGIHACFVKLDGAACTGDDNCPSGVQYCGRDNLCHMGATPVDLACERILKSLADKVATCRISDGEALQRVIDANRLCRAQVSSVDAGRQAYDAKALPACLARIQTRACSDLTDLTVTGLLAGCSAFAPQVESGGSCRNSLDCTAGFYCNTSAQCPGQCVALIQAEVPCDPAGAGCKPNTTCFGGTCRAPLPADAGCNSLFTPPCAQGLGCVSGLCAPQVGADGGCTVLGTECQPQMACTGSGFSGRSCQPAKALGAACNPGQSECGYFLWCNAASSQCERWARYHEPCGFINGEFVGCLDGRCASSLCEAFFVPGEKCSSNSDCGPAARCAQINSTTSVCRSIYCE